MSIVDEKQTEASRTRNFFSRSIIADRTTVRDDGRVDFVVDSTIGRLASRLIQQDTAIYELHGDTPRPATPPPQYSPVESSSHLPTVSSKPYSDATPLGIDPLNPDSSKIDPPKIARPKKPQTSLRLNIVIQVVGSRGDVQPFLALGTALQTAGHRVRIATHPTFMSFVLSSGLEFFSVGGDPAELMAFMVKNPGLVPSLPSILAGDVQQKRAMVRTILEGCWRSCVEPDETTGAPFVADAIIANPPSFAHVHCAQALSIPLHIMFTMPWTSTRAFSHPLANVAVSGTGIDQGVANYASFWLVEWMTWQGLGDVINEWRVSIDLEPVPTTEGPKLLETLRVPVTYCWSPALVPKPTDWPSNIDICGFFFRDPPDYTPPPALASWLQNGPTPIYVGFGSIVIDDPQRLDTTIVRAARQTGVRAIISKGWSNLGGETVGQNAEGDIFYLGDCPHEWLFQNVSAVIHHGGAGTTACGLLNGRPTTIVPFFGDQPFWGEMVATAGAGPKPIPQKDISLENLTAAIRYCLTPEALAAAGRISASIQAENGVQQAVRSFHEHILAYNIRCDIFPERPASWAYKSGGKLFKMSTLAGSALTDASLVTKKQLKPFAVHPFEIRNQRWDPFTGVASAALSTGKGMLVSSADIIVKPIQTYRSMHPSNPAHPSDPQESLDPDPLQPGAKLPTHVLLSRDLESGLTTSRAGRRGCIATAAALTSSSAQGVGGFFKAYGKGFFLDIPLSAAEGLRAVPKMYGEEVEDRRAITGWKSGAMAGGKQFVAGFAGVSDLVTQPVKGAVEDGAVGAAKGLGKGFVGFATKLLSAPLGLVAYSFQGIYQEIRAITSKTAVVILDRRHEEGAYLVRVEEGKGNRPISRAIQTFYRLQADNRRDNE
ncbi:related to sterol glucosyltransferase [Cephalotrichum gorgonifer]|uniref:Related to sterol glucosyltransferase n=1 Tax=Cephalotrichum gorgonifer TaxID=2041049 RepID=A0AAE8MNS2_9PEZI|nr:related to sterol glucosyltransferase [Cephalotrichum gorgonifer]